MFESLPNIAEWPAPTTETWLWTLGGAGLVILAQVSARFETVFRFRDLKRKAERDLALAEQIRSGRVKPSGKMPEVQPIPEVIFYAIVAAFIAGSGAYGLQAKNAQLDTVLYVAGAVIGLLVGIIPVWRMLREPKEIGLSSADIAALEKKRQENWYMLALSIFTMVVAIGLII